VVLPQGAQPVEQGSLLKGTGSPCRKTLSGRAFSLLKVRLDLGGNSSVLKQGSLENAIRKEKSPNLHDLRNFACTDVSLHRIVLISIGYAL
jgi:hypothetical protein